MRKLALLLLALSGVSALAQEPPEAPPVVSAPDTGSPNTLTSLSGEFFRNNFVNVFGFVNGVYDSTQQTLQNGNNSGGSSGIDVGGGIQASHQFSTSLLSLNYRGDYRNYSGNYLGTGTDQYLMFDYAARIGRRWTISVAEAGGILFYGNSFYGTIPNGGGGVQTNPFSPSTRFSSSSVYLSYQQSRRLTYTVGGSFFVNRYTYPGAIGSTGGIASASVSYQMTFLTSIGATYSHDDFFFQHNAGGSHINGVYGTVNHRFRNRFSVTGSAGVTRANTSGTIAIPIDVILPGGQPGIGYLTGLYNVTRNIPTFQASLSRSFRRYTFSVSGGRGVTPGNGTVLTSAQTFVGGVASRSFQRSNISAAGYYSHISSIANQVTSTYSQMTASASYGYTLGRHISAAATYSYFRYGGFLNYGGIADNRLTFGLNFSTKNIPLTLF